MTAFGKDSNYERLYAAARERKAVVTLTVGDTLQRLGAGAERRELDRLIVRRGQKRIANITILSDVEEVAGRALKQLGLTS